MERASCREAGYALLEFLVAFALLTAVLAALLSIVTMAIRDDRRAAFQASATMLARSKLAGAGLDFPLRPGVAQGRFDNGYEWRATVRRDRLVRLDENRLVESFRIEVSVYDPRDLLNQPVSLSGLELAPGSTR